MTTQLATAPEAGSESELTRQAWIRIDGQPVPAENAAVSVFDHGLLYGDGIFESMRFVNRRVFELDAHLERLAASAHAICLTLPYPLDQLRGQVRDLVADTGRDDGYIRMLVTRGVGDLGLSPAVCPRATVIVIAAPITLSDNGDIDRGLRAVTLAGRQKAVDLLGPRIKSLNYLPNVLGHLDARAAGADEGIFLTPEGYVSEGTVENVFVVRHGALVHPDPACAGLDGITARAVCTLAARDGITVEPAWLTRFDMYTADEAFLTGTAVGLVPLVELDGRAIGSGTPGPVTRRLYDLLRQAMARGRVD